jgi:hypothetical protein
LLVKPTPRNVNLGSGRFAMFNKERDMSRGSLDFREPETALAMRRKRAEDDGEPLRVGADLWISGTALPGPQLEPAGMPELWAKVGDGMKV